MRMRFYKGYREFLKFYVAINQYEPFKNYMPILIIAFCLAYLGAKRGNILVYVVGIITMRTVFS